MVGVNTGRMSSEAAPVGGMKQSGIGREGSRHGLEDSFEMKIPLHGWYLKNLLAGFRRSGTQATSEYGPSMGADGRLRNPSKTQHGSLISVQLNSTVEAQRNTLASAQLR